MSQKLKKVILIHFKYLTIPKRLKKTKGIKLSLV